MNTVLRIPVRGLIAVAAVVLVTAAVVAFAASASVQATERTPSWAELEGAAQDELTRLGVESEPAEPVAAYTQHWLEQRGVEASYDDETGQLTGGEPEEVLACGRELASLARGD